ncbi:bacterio-opsin activator domain-containing protein [Haloplanus sp.]|uniref:bacterio-opsin activator domain-containing protein n=1 Tax=Haloplanus sp. TaxID=1961696 RepID=UPI00261E7FB8|nr:bacterio-opsin activator domain-containing protein [Haloplanus sp.]
MNEQDRHETIKDGDRPNRVESAAHGSVAWRDRFGTEGSAPERGTAGEDRGSGTSGENAHDEPTNALGAVTRASELFPGLPDDLDDGLRTYVSELPRWFRRPRTIETEIRVDGDVFETDGFHPTTDRLTAEAHTRTGTDLSVTVACTDRRTWLASERELVEAVVSVLRDGLDRLETDSLERVPDGVVVLDGDLRCTHVNRQAERFLGRDRQKLRGEHVRGVLSGVADTSAEDEFRTALDTRSPTSFERYDAHHERWVGVEIHPAGNSVIAVFTESTDSNVARREPNHVLETAPVGIVLLDAGGDVTHANSRAEELLGLSRHDMAQQESDDSDWDIWDETGAPIPHGDHPVTRARRTGEVVQGFTHGITLPDGSERWLSSNVTPVRNRDGSVRRIIVALEDITGPKRLEQLVRTIQPVNEALNGATPTDETEQTLCELLTETRAYQRARLIEHTPGTPLTERAVSDHQNGCGDDESVSVSTQSRTEVGPAEAAVETGEIQVVTGSQRNSRFGRWRAHTLNQGFQGGAIVPLEHRGRTHGLLVLYTDRGEAFGGYERTLLTTLGERTGQVLHSLAMERVLHTDSVAELTFNSTDTGSFFIFASKQLGCTVEITGTIPTANETFVHYVSVRNASLDSLADIAEHADCDAELRRVRRTEDPPGGDVEIELQRRSLVQTLVTAGAVVTTDLVADGQAEVVCEVPLGTDISSLVTRVQQSFPDTTFVSKREYTGSSGVSVRETGRVLRDTFDDELTDRQQQVLRAAIHGGYFESPRRSTATEIADALCLTQSTVSYHLRKAQQTLFERLFDRSQRQ